MTVIHADDTVIVISAKFQNTVSQLLQETLSLAQQWCDRTQLSINPQEMLIEPFTSKGNQPSLGVHYSWLPSSNTLDLLQTGTDREGTAKKHDE